MQSQEFKEYYKKGEIVSMVNTTIIIHCNHTFLSNSIDMLNMLPKAKSGFNLIRWILFSK